MMDGDELRAKGWTLVDGISSKGDLLELGRTIGTPTRTPNGEYVKEIRRFSAGDAPPGSLSAIYGEGPFPLHTDTAFWETPARYIILRGYGDARRPTTVMSFEKLTQDCDDRFHADLHRAVFRVVAGNASFYCSMRFRNGDDVGWRYDADIMRPVNIAADRVHTELRHRVKREDVDSITWTKSGSIAAVLCNWRVLHGRAVQPPDEGLRIIDRIYVR